MHLHPETSFVSCFSSLKSGLVSCTDCSRPWLQQLEGPTQGQRCGSCGRGPAELPSIYLHFLSFLAQWENDKSTHRFLIAVIKALIDSWSQSFHWCLLSHVAHCVHILSFSPQNVNWWCGVFFKNPKNRIKPQRDYEVMAINKGKATSGSSVSNDSDCSQFSVSVTAMSLEHSSGTG